PDAHAFTLENVTVDMTGADKKFPAIAMASTKVSNHPPVRRPVGGMVWNNVTIIVPEGQTPIWYRDDTGSGFGLFDITGTITVKQSADDPGETIMIDQQWLSEHFPGIREPKEPEEKPAEE
ncbi:MAG: hypothetical protein J6S75_05635, partial [Thermoguttaceae bacterium]|nr:hypothetical protein [Thermoguttaceae bacterium]